MKKATIILVLALSSIIAFAQKKKADTVQIDSTHKIPSDTTALFSYQDYYEFEKQVTQELPAKYADVIRAWWDRKIRQKISVFTKPKK
jgi:hypothetical protein